MCVEIAVANAAKQIGDHEVLSGFDAFLRSFFEHHKANDALKYSAVFQENDVNMETIFYIFWIAMARPIKFDKVAASVYPPLH